MARGKKPHLDRPIEVSVNIPETLIAKVSLLLFDPVRGTRKHGALSALITGLLKEWVSAHGLDHPSTAGSGENNANSAGLVGGSMLSSGDNPALKE